MYAGVQLKEYPLLSPSSPPFLNTVFIYLRYTAGWGLVMVLSSQATSLPLQSWSHACWPDEAALDKLHVNPGPSLALRWQTGQIRPHVASAGQKSAMHMIFGEETDCATAFFEISISCLSIFSLLFYGNPVLINHTTRQQCLQSLSCH